MATNTIMHEDEPELEELAELYTVTQPIRVRGGDLSGPVEIEIPDEELDLVDLMELG